MRRSPPESAGRTTSLRGDRGAAHRTTLVGRRGSLARRQLAGDGMLAVGAVLATADDGDGDTQDASGASEQTAPLDKRAPPPTRPAVCRVVTAPRSTPPPLLSRRAKRQASSKLPGRRSASSSPRRRASSSSTSRPELAAINPTEVVALGDVRPVRDLAAQRPRARHRRRFRDRAVREAVANDQVALVWPTPELRAQAVSIDGAVAVPEPAVERCQLVALHRPDVSVDRAGRRRRRDGVERPRSGAAVASGQLARPDRTEPRH